MWESALCELWRGVSSPNPHLSDSEVLIPVEKTQQISHVISQLETPDLHRWCVRHRWRWLLQEKRVGVHLQVHRHGSINPKPYQSTSCTCPLASNPRPGYSLSGYATGYASTRGEALVSPCVTLLPLKAMAETTRLSCLRLEVQKTSNSPPTIMDLNSILQAAYLRYKTLGGHEDHTNGLISCFNRTRDFPVMCFKAQPIVSPACAKASQCCMPAPCSTGHCIYSTTSCTNHCGRLNCPRTSSCTAKSRFILSPWGKKIRDYSHGDFFFKTTVSGPCHPRGMSSLKLLPDCVTTSCEPILYVLPTLLPPENTSLWYTVIYSDSPSKAGEEFDADDNGDPVGQCLDNFHSSSRHDVETEESDNNDVVGSGASDLSTQCESSDGTESLIEQAGYWSLSATLKSSLEEPHLHSTPSGSSDQHNTSHLKKSVSFLEEVTIFLFDKDAPTHDLGALCSSVDTSVSGSSSGHADPSSAEAIHDVDDELEWEDDFSTVLSSLPVLRKGCHFPRSQISDAFVQPHSSACLRHDWVKCSAYSITHITDSDLE
ncbi:hypothetical protein ACEWY4_025868 [Coilia grayii]|uniref:Uncharacterized protein n=1 Tax=Coilia grayii TaxID=363190 RepID=A0ABD1IX68_9TELE